MNNNFDTTVESLFKGMDSFISTKTVVGDAVTIGDTIILPLVDVSFGVGAGAFSGEKKQNAGADSLSRRESGVAEIKRNQKENKRAAVNERQSLRFYGIVGTGEELGKEFNGGKAEVEGIVRHRKAGFPEGKRVGGREKNDGGATDGNNAVQPGAQKRTQEVIAFSEGIVVPLFRVGKEVKKEVDGHKYTGHEPDIEVGQERERKRNRKEEKAPVFDEGFQAEGDQREQDKIVDPHGIVLHDDGKSREGVHHREEERGTLSGNTVFMKIVSEREAA